MKSFLQNRAFMQSFIIASMHDRLEFEKGLRLSNKKVCGKI